MICTRFGFLDDRADDQLDRRLLKRERVADAGAVYLRHATENSFHFRLNTRLEEKREKWLLATLFVSPRGLSMSMVRRHFFIVSTPRRDARTRLWSYLIFSYYSHTKLTVLSSFLLKIDSTLANDRPTILKLTITSKFRVRARLPDSAFR